MTQQKNDNDLGAGLIHQAIPDMEDTEPRPNRFLDFLDSLGRAIETISQPFSEASGSVPSAAPKSNSQIKD